MEVMWQALHTSVTEATYQATETTVPNPLVLVVVPQSVVPEVLAAKSTLIKQLCL